MINKLKNCWLCNGLKGHKTVVLTRPLPTLTSIVSHAGMWNTKLNPPPPPPSFPQDFTMEVHVDILQQFCVDYLF